MQAALKEAGVPAVVYYPIPLSRQPAYRHYPSAPTPVSEALCGTVISLPMHHYLDEATQDRIISAVLAAAK
jgi:dTDP-4-amino-4,6-dideoxygalactose transaminase